MASPWFTKQRLQLLSGVALLLVVGAVLWWQFMRPPAATPTNTNAVRQEYASLYQAAWRQDTGTQPTLATATLLLPAAQQALGRDAGRSTTEDQLWDIFKNLKGTQIPVILTFDSVSGFVPDAVVKEGSSLLLDGGPNVSLTDWQPVSSPSRVVNTAGTVRSQIGVAIFSAGQTIDWNTIKQAQLVLRGIPNETDRVFTWIEPRVLLEVQ